MKIEKIASQWYQMVGHPSGVRAAFRCHWRGSWGVYFRQDSKPAFGMEPGEELFVHSRREAERVAALSLVRGRIVR